MPCLRRAGLSRATARVCMIDSETLHSIILFCIILNPWERSPDLKERGIKCCIASDGPRRTHGDHDVYVMICNATRGCSTHCSTHIHQSRVDDTQKLCKLAELAMMEHFRSDSTCSVCHLKDEKVRRCSTFPPRHVLYCTVRNNMSGLGPDPAGHGGAGSGPSPVELSGEGARRLAPQTHT